MGEDIGLSDQHLLALWKKEGRNTLEIGGEKLGGRGENVDEAEERGFVESLDRSYNLLTVRTLVAVEENRDVGVCRH